MKNAGKARSYGLYRHLRTSKEIIENLLNYYFKNITDQHIRRSYSLFNCSLRKLKQIITSHF